MLGPNPKKAATPSSSSSTSSNNSETPNTNLSGDGLMVRAIADIFKFVEESENPQEFKVRRTFCCFKMREKLHK